MLKEKESKIVNQLNSYIKGLLSKQREQSEKKNEDNFGEEKIVENGSKENSHSAQLKSLSNEDMERLVLLIKMKQRNSASFPNFNLPLSKENRDEIKNLIVEYSTNTNNKQFIDHIEINALLTKLLKASQLLELIDSRIHFSISDKISKLIANSEETIPNILNRQSTLIGELNSEVALIKLALSDKISENKDLQQSVNNLKLNEKELMKRLQEYEQSTNKQVSLLFTENENKLNAIRDEKNILLNKQIKLAIFDIFGFKITSDMNLEDTDLINNWARKLFVDKEYLEKRLREINTFTNSRINEEINRNGVTLMRDITDRLKTDIFLAIEKKYQDVDIEMKGELSENYIKKIVKSVLAIYDADKTGLVDFALESAGGQIISTRCTENYQIKTAQISVFGIPLWYPRNTPRVVISPNVQPGECWAFQGFPGFLVLKLNSFVNVTGFSLEHIPKSLSPSGRVESAPRNFSVWGLEYEKDQDPILFGLYEYLDNEASLQYFPVHNQNIKQAYEIIELRIESNHGHPLYTCLYRFRVHGKQPIT